MEPTDLTVMAAALDDLVERLKLSDDASARAVIATGIIDPSRAGERDANWLRAQGLHEVNTAERFGRGVL